jgi:predicted nucleic acid-binding protein
LIYLDANVIIRFVEGAAISRDPIRQRLANERQLITSQLSLLECRCMPMGRSDQVLLDLFDRFFGSRELRLTEIDRTVIDEATRVRAQFQFSSPDAIHLSSAVIAGANVFLTGDRKLSRFSQLPVEII